MYTNVAKPTDRTYTKVKNGYPLFDDTTISYDDSSWYYDGDSPTAYTKLTKPSAGSYTKIAKPI